MSTMQNDYFYSRPLQQTTPAWYRLERYDYCETLSESSVSAKRSIFSRRIGKKRSK